MSYISAALSLLRMLVVIEYCVLSSREVCKGQTSRPSARYVPLETGQPCLDAGQEQEQEQLQQESDTISHSLSL